jgi:D-alanyl-D-alanine-carboxypeptidase/D-alanyl-D-alanine-endopeptidase
LDEDEAPLVRAGLLDPLFKFGFDLLAMAMSAAAKKPYPDLLKEHITGPLDMKDTVFALTDEQKTRLMVGHDFDGKPLC